MSTPTGPRREHPSTYVVQDRNNKEELLRLKLQDQMITAGMGGPLSEQPDPTIFHRVLDIGCGTGGWLIQTANTYPSIGQLIGVDVSSRFIHYAREQVEDSPELAQRIEFTTMDALRMLEFPDHFFDLVNERLGMSYLRTWDWYKFLLECIRVTHPGGVIRFTEYDIAAETNSPALNQLNTYLSQAFHQAGHIFSNDRRSLIDELPNLFTRHDMQNIQVKEYALHFQAGTQQCDLLIQDATHIYRTLLPFLKKWIKVPDDYEAIYQQMLTEIHQPDFESTLTYLTIWGTTPIRNSDPHQIQVR
jgi:ubiquinone/menaquinone biosynthesis C-methylase UbiE